MIIGSKSLKDQFYWQNKHIKENYGKLSITIEKDELEQFKTICKETGTSQRSVIVDAVRKFISQHQKR